ncbi:MAG: hypothetical protein ACRCVW_06020 [Brevinema sp.]
MNNKTISEIWLDHKDNIYLIIPKKNNSSINYHETIELDRNKITDKIKCYQSSITNILKDFRDPNIKKPYNRSDWKYNRKQILIEENLIPKSMRQDYSNQNIFGIWYDPYNDSYISNANILEIDHVIPLYHIHYAQGMYVDKKRKKYLTDTSNSNPSLLVSIYGKANRLKSNKTPYNYIPPNQKFINIYKQIWIDLQQEYHLKRYPEVEKILLNN